MAEQMHRAERRRSAGRRATDYQGRFSLMTFVPALCGALVIVYLFFVAVSGSEVAEEPGWAIGALVLALVWFVFSWRRLLSGGASPAGDRERRGF